MKINKKPHLAGLQEFGVAAYVKDLKAGKLDAQAQLGWFVGYDSESKGYQIYWPGKCLVTVEHNIVFNENDVFSTMDYATIPGDVLVEGENEKIIQHPRNNAKNIEKPDIQEASDPQLKHEPVNKHHHPQSSNSVPFPSIPEIVVEPESEASDDSQSQQYGHGQCPRKPIGAYKDLNNGLTAAVVHCKDLETKNDPLAEIHEDEDLLNILPPDFSLIGSFNSKHSSLDRALWSPNAKEWQTALEYEIGQLKKLQTWAIEDLPKGHNAIPCNEVLKIKRGPNGKVQSYRVRIVAGGHRQVEGLNYTETFSAAAKMPTVCIVLANAVEQDREIEHVDVKSAYLNALLKETIYMKPPQESWNQIKKENFVGF